jgi:hypothetical protein
MINLNVSSISPSGRTRAGRNRKTRNPHPATDNSVPSSQLLYALLYALCPLRLYPATRNLTMAFSVDLDNTRF